LNLQTTIFGFRIKNSKLALESKLLKEKEQYRNKEKIRTIFGPFFIFLSQPVSGKWGYT